MTKSLIVNFLLLVLRKEQNICFLLIYVIATNKKMWHYLSSKLMNVYQIAGIILCLLYNVELYVNICTFNSKSCEEFLKYLIFYLIFTTHASGCNAEINP